MAGINSITSEVLTQIPKIAEEMGKRSVKIAVDAINTKNYVKVEGNFDNKAKTAIEASLQEIATKAKEKGLKVKISNYDKHLHLNVDDARVNVNDMKAYHPDLIRTVAGKTLRRGSANFLLPPEHINKKNILTQFEYALRDYANNASKSKTKYQPNLERDLKVLNARIKYHPNARSVGTIKAN